MKWPGCVCGAILIFAAAALLNGCGGNAVNTPSVEESSDKPKDLKNSKNTDEHENSKGRESSKIMENSENSENIESGGTVLLLSLEQTLKDAGLDELCEKYGFEIVYDYKNFNMAAVKTQRKYSDDELEQLIDALMEEDGVIYAQKDQVMQLD